MKRKQAQPAEVVLEVRLQPRASRNEILGYQDGYLRIRVTAPPKDGEANQLLRKVLAEALGVPVSGVEILSGQKARRKRVRVTNALPAGLEELKTLQKRPEP